MQPPAQAPVAERGSSGLSVSAAPGPARAIRGWAPFSPAAGSPQQHAAGLAHEHSKGVNATMGGLSVMPAASNAAGVPAQTDATRLPDQRSYPVPAHEPPQTQYGLGLELAQNGGRLSARPLALADTSFKVPSRRLAYGSRPQLMPSPSLPPAAQQSQLGPSATAAVPPYQAFVPAFAGGGPAAEPDYGIVAELRQPGTTGAHPDTVRAASVGFGLAAEVARRRARPDATPAGLVPGAAASARPRKRLAAGVDFAPAHEAAATAGAARETDTSLPGSAVPSSVLPPGIPALDPFNEANLASRTDPFVVAGQLVKFPPSPLVPQPQVVPGLWWSQAWSG
jgi:hypothetical protein